MTAVVPGEQERREHLQRSGGLFSTFTNMLNAKSLMGGSAEGMGSVGGGGGHQRRIGSRRGGNLGGSRRKVSFTEQIWTNFGSGGASHGGAHTTRQRRNSILAKVLGKDAEEAEHDALVNQHMILPGEGEREREGEDSAGGGRQHSAELQG